MNFIGKIQIIYWIHDCQYKKIILSLVYMYKLDLLMKHTSFACAKFQNSFTDFIK